MLRFTFAQIKCPRRQTAPWLGEKTRCREKQNSRNLEKKIPPPCFDLPPFTLPLDAGEGKQTAPGGEYRACNNFFLNMLCRNKGTDYICRTNANIGKSENTAVG